MAGHKGSVLAVAVASTALLAASSAEAQQKLSGPEIRKLVAGRSATWASAEGYKGSITYNPNGTLTANTRVMGMNQNLTGTWSIRGDRFCRSVSMELVRERCQTVQAAPGGTYRFYNDDGKLATTTTFR